MISTIKRLTLLLSLILLFHLLILIKVIPYTIAWGGRLTNDQEMYVMESVSLVLNVILLIALYIKSQPTTRKGVNAVLWVFLVLFALNTMGNLFAKTAFEKGFAGVTLVLAVLLWKVLRPTQ